MMSGFSTTSRGFSMIEVLIAVLILAIGLLGVAALQMASMNSGQEGYFRTQATAIAEDYISRIKAGRQAVIKIRDGAGAQLWVSGSKTQAVDTYLSQFVANPLACAAPPAFCRPDETEGTAGQLCSIAELAAFEASDICNQANALLPGGTVHVRKDVGSLRLSVAVAWDATAARDDVGEEAVIVNALCNSQFGIAVNRDCVIVEAIP